MSLLERRIAELEALLSKSDESTSTPTDSIASPTVDKTFDVPDWEKESGADKSKANGTGGEKKVSCGSAACYFYHYSNKFESSHNSCCMLPFELST